MILKLSFVLVALVLAQVSCDVYDDKVIFTVSTGSSSVVWNHTNTTLTSLGCEKSGKFAIFTHGWRGAGDDWIKTLNENLLKTRGGCVIHLDWGEFAKNINYFWVRWTHWPKVASLLVRKLKQMEAEGVDPANIYLYGHSLGARMVIEAGLKFGANRIGMIDACDPAGPEYYLYDAVNDAKRAAKNVQCIHTSILAGTMTRNCHQNFILGECGVSQPAARNLLYLCQAANVCSSNTTEAEISHTLCNDFYNSAFENNFVANNVNRCWGTVDVKTLPVGYKMGYDESRTPTVKGIIPVPTSKDYPYNVV